MVRLGAELEVGHQDGHRRTSDNQDTVREEEEAKHVVHPGEPDGGHDEVEFHKDCSTNEISAWSVNARILTREAFQTSRSKERPAYRMTDSESVAVSDSS